MDHLFVVTYGRSGSTVLQNLLNAIDGYCIRGENLGILIDLATAAHKVQEAVETSGIKITDSNDKFEPTYPWYGIEQADAGMFAEELARSFEKAVIRAPAGTRVCGFKEIRFVRSWITDDQFRNVIDFMFNAFSGTRIIFGTRDAKEVANSGWWRDDDEAEVIADIKHCDALFAQAHAQYPERSLIVDYSEFKNSESGLKNILDWLGEEIDPDLLSSISGTRLMHLQPSENEQPRFLERLRSRFRL